MVVLVAGASGGFGGVLARLLASRGMTVYGTMRDPQAAEADLPFTMLAMEIGDSGSIESCVKEVVRREGRLDVVVNCVNRMIIGAIEEQSVDEVREVFETNVLGALRVWQAVLPVMRDQGSGIIVNMSSLGGIFAVPYMSAYTSSKSALEAMSEAMHHELREEPIDVVIMQPVAMALDRPAAGSHLELVEAAGVDSPSQRMLKRMDLDTQASGLTPEAVAEKVHGVITAERRPLRVPLDRARPMGLLKRLAPQRLIDRVIAGLLPSA